MKKIVIVFSLILFVLPFVSKATRIEIPGYYVSTEVANMSPSGVVTVRVVCAVVSQGVCTVIEAAPVLPPVIEAIELQEYSTLLNNSDITLFQGDLNAPIYSGSLQTIMVNPFFVEDQGYNELNFIFNAEPGYKPRHQN